MDDLTMFGNSFDDCLDNLEIFLKRCVEKEFMLSWNSFDDGYSWNCFMSCCIY